MDLPRIFRQTAPCSDCPFLKHGGERHGVAATFTYARYFTEDPPVTFPCHQTRGKDRDNSTWTPWTEGQTVCAGGLIFAGAINQENSLLRLAQRKGWYAPKNLRGKETICADWQELADAQKDHP